LISTDFSQTLSLDWDTSDYIKSLYTAYKVQPEKIHIVTNAITKVTSLMWSFHQKESDLHTLHAWIGVGSIFSRSKAVQFLDMIDSRLSVIESEFADVYFTMWGNNEPSTYTLRIRQYTNDHAFSGEVDFIERLKASQRNAIRILYNDLAQNTTRESSSEHLRRSMLYVLSLTVSSSELHGFRRSFRLII